MGIGLSYCLPPTLSRASGRSVPEAHPLPLAGEGERLPSPFLVSRLSANGGSLR
jgi:hypothetical protein